MRAPAPARREGPRLGDGSSRLFATPGAPLVLAIPRPPERRQEDELEATMDDEEIARLFAESERQSASPRVLRAVPSPRGGARRAESTENDAVIAALVAELPPSPLSARLGARSPSLACCADDAAIAAALAAEEEEEQEAGEVAAAEPRRAEPVARQREVCLACQEEPANACFIPCGHINVCMACSRRIYPHRCPVCRLAFHAIVKAD